MTHRLLSIAGSDSGGGAGIQADIKTACAFGVYASTAITAVTVQNTLGVSAVEAMPPTLVHDQIGAVLSDIGADAVKIGMVVNEGICRAIADALEGMSIPIVLDPVMVSTSGHRLLDPGAIDALIETLVPKAVLITPNLPELDVLCDLVSPSDAERRRAARAFVAERKTSLLLKGGHAEGPDLDNILITEQAEQVFSYKRLDTVQTHGTGCTLSAAIACLLAKGVTLPRAIEIAGAFVHQAISSAPGLGSGRGPLDFFAPIKS